MEPHSDDPDSEGSPPPPGSPVLEALLENARNQQYLGQRLDAAGDRVDIGSVVDRMSGPAFCEEVVRTRFGS